MFVASPANGEFSVPEQWANTSFKVSPSATIATEAPSLSEDSMPRALLIGYFIENIFIYATKKPTDETLPFIISNTSLRCCFL